VNQNTSIISAFNLTIVFILFGMLPHISIIVTVTTFVTKNVREVPADVKNLKLIAYLIHMSKLLNDQVR
jgi:hypothetical protein